MPDNPGIVILFRALNKITMRITKKYLNKAYLGKRVESFWINTETKRFASDFPGFYFELFQVKGTFTYRVESVKYLDLYLKKLAEVETEKCDLDIIMFVVGAHLGEIIRNEIGGRWVRSRQTSSSPSDIDFETEFQLPNGLRLDLTAKSWSSFGDNNARSLRRYLKAIKKQVQSEKASQLNQANENPIQRIQAKRQDQCEAVQCSTF